MTLERDNINPPHPSHPSHRADTPYDQEQDQPPEDALFLSTRALFAVTTGLVLLAGLIALVYGFVRDTTGVTWAGVVLVAAGCVGLRVLWVRGQE